MASGDPQRHAGLAGGLIASIVMVVVLSAAAIAVIAVLALRFKGTTIIDYSDCRQEQHQGVSTGTPARRYWLGACTGGVALFTLRTVTSVAGDVAIPYVLTAFSASTGSTVVMSPMLGNPLLTSEQSSFAVTPPPPLASFDWELIGVQTLDQFVKKAVYSSVSASLGVVAKLALVPISTTTYSADFVFICTPTGTPLCVLGGLLTADNVQYNIGCMPLTTMLSGTLNPGVSMLDVAPMLPLLGGANEGFDPTSLNIANAPNNLQPYNENPPPPLQCLLASSYQTQTSIVPPPPTPKGSSFISNPGSVLTANQMTTVHGCVGVPVPSFDIVDPANVVPNTRTYVDGLYPESAPSQPVVQPPGFIAVSGLQSGWGVARMRAWTFAKTSTTPKGADANIYEVLKQSNPSITNASQTSGNNPYASLPIAIPAQYRPVSGQVNAMTLLYPSPGPHWRSDQPTAMCVPSGQHVTDPAYSVASGLPLPDEPILMLLNRSRGTMQRGRVIASPYNMVIGFGMTTGTLYVQAPRSLTTMPAPAVLLDSTKTCATCASPALTTRTCCWPLSSGPVPAAPPVPQISLLIVDGTGSNDRPCPTSGAKFPCITNAQLDQPYVAIGAAVGAPSQLDGGHASNVMPWMAIVTAPTGNASGMGFGDYHGAPGEGYNIVGLKVEGSCSSVWNG